MHFRLGHNMPGKGVGRRIGFPLPCSPAMIVPGQAYCFGRNGGIHPSVLSRMRARRGRVVGCVAAAAATGRLPRRSCFFQASCEGGDSRRPWTEWPPANASGCQRKGVTRRLMEGRVDDSSLRLACAHAHRAAGRPGGYDAVSTPDSRACAPCSSATGRTEGVAIPGRPFHRCLALCQSRRRPARKRCQGQLHRLLLQAHGRATCRPRCSTEDMWNACAASHGLPSPSDLPVRDTRLLLAASDS